MSKIYQIKVQLKKFKPSSYRTIYIESNNTFEDLNECINDYFWFFWWHLHEFLIQNWFQKIVITNVEDDWGWYYDSSPSDKNKLSKYFKYKNDKCTYMYDFWDWWEFDITLQDILDSKDLDVDDYPYLKKWKWIMCYEDIWWVWWLETLIDLYKNKKYDEISEMIWWESKDSEFIDVFMEEIIDPDFEQFR